MRTAKQIMTPALVLGLGFGLAACSTSDVPTRNTPFEALPATAAQAPEGYVAKPAVSTLSASELKSATTGAPIVAPVVARAATVESDVPTELVAIAPKVTVDSVRVRVPRSLTVSERNSYLPRGDIVWREDPIGDRHAQVAKIMQDALTKGVEPLDGPIHVVLDIEVNRFHALTEKTRYTYGGVHSISFDMALIDPKTGEVLVPPRTVNADLEGFGGKQALEAEARGLTQKVRISDYLAEVIRQELSNPEGYKNASLGLIQLWNRM
jgi:hypothetical protein